MDTTVTKKDLCERVSESTGQPRVNVRVIVQAFLDEVVAQLAEGKRLEFREFGVFEPRTRAARRGRNPKTSAPVSVPAKRTIRFKPGLKIRMALETGVANAKVSEPAAKAKAAGRNAGRAGARQEAPLIEVRRQAGVGV